MHTPFSGRPLLTILALSLVMIFPGQGLAQAWTLPQGASYTKVSYGRSTAAFQYTFDGRRVDFIDGLPGDTFRDRSLYLYSEIGLLKNATLVLNVPYKRIFVRDHAFRFRIFGMGTVQLGLRMGLLPLFGVRSSPHALALTGTLGIPTGYTRNYTPSVGAGQVDGMLSLHYGISLWPFPGYAQAGAGLRYRSSLFSLSRTVPCQPGNDITCLVDRKPAYGHEMIYSGEIGITPLDGALLFQVMGGAIWSLQAPEVGFSALNPIPTHQRATRWGAGAGLYPFRLLGTSFLKALGVSAQYFITPNGRNALDARELFVGIDYRFAGRDATP